MRYLIFTDLNAARSLWNMISYLSYLFKRYILGNRGPENEQTVSSEFNENGSTVSLTKSILGLYIFLNIQQHQSDTKIEWKDI